MRRKRVLIFGRRRDGAIPSRINGRRNQEQRVHLLLPSWPAHRAIQGLGRTPSTHQASTPLFRPVTTDRKGELRFTSISIARLDSPRTQYRVSARPAVRIFDPADNLESEYACAALVTWFHLLVDGKLKSIRIWNSEDRTGLFELRATRTAS